MKICIYGAGAIGGYMAVCLAEAGYAVSVVARGPHLEAIRSDGLTLLSGGERRCVQVQASDDPSVLGPQDYVITTLKAHSIPAVAAQMATLFHERTAVVTAVNGLPWWYFHGVEGPLAGVRLESVDPGGVIWDTLGAERAIGCVVYPACEVSEPGVIQHVEGDRFTLGEPTGERTERVMALSDALRAGGLKAPVKPRIRDEIWIKLWGNVSFNPISALTRATLDRILAADDVRAVARSMMLEAQAIAEATGVRFAIDVDRRLAGGEAVGVHKTSMLQDIERGRPMEIDATVASVQELGKLLGIPTPTIDTVLALVRLCGEEAGCYRR
jgi:2-dehydropantoate 2-reductase